MPRISTDNYDTVASWNGSQDLFVVEQPDGTKVATPAMVKQYVLGNSIDDIYSVMGQNGAKNLIPCPYYRASGYSSNGMTTTYDSDGVLTINKVAGSSTAFFALTYTTDNYCLKPNTKYKLLVEFDNTTQFSVFAKYGDIDIAIINKKSTGKYAVNFTTPQTLEGRENIAIYAAASDTETNAKVKVMIMLASDTDETYQPYAKTNKELTEVIGDISQTGLTGDSVAEQLGDANTALSLVDTTKIKTVKLNKNQSATISANVRDYWAMMAVCYIPGEGGRLLGFVYTNGTGEVKNMWNGNAFSSSYVDFTFSSTGLTVTTKNYNGYVFSFIVTPPAAS
jgi:hypothetical protein